MDCCHINHDSQDICGKCNSNNLVDFNHSQMTLGECGIVTKVSNNPNLLLAMSELKEKDIIEYELKMSQFRAQYENQKQIQNNQPKCPTCGSADIEKISITRKTFGGAMFGLFSSDVRNTMHCRCCGAKW